MVKRNRNTGKCSFACVAVLLLAAAAVIWHKPTMAYADANNFTVTNFAADYYLSNADPQGEMRVTERIDVNFTDQNHGLLRALPQKYAGHSLHLRVNKVSSSSAAPSAYTTYPSNGNTVLKIGDANRTVTGPQQYTIDYTVDNVMQFYPFGAQLYWNINGVGWDQPFGHVSAVLHLPSGIQISTAEGAQPVCYTGIQGSTSTDCSISVAGSTVSVESRRPLLAGQNVSFAIDFDNGYFKAPGIKDKLAEYWKPAAAIVVLPLLTGVYCFYRWRKVGRDPKSSGTIVPAYEVPDGISPVEMGLIINFHVASRDITAMIIDLAVRKYLKIIESDTKRLLAKDSTSYELELLNSDFSALSGDEQLLLTKLFTVAEIDRRQSIRTASSALHDVAQTIRANTGKRMTEAGYFATNPLKAARPLYWVIGVLVVIVALLIAWFSWAIIVGAVLAALVAAVFIRIMPARTLKGVDILDKIKGLKLYLQTAEADRIKMLQAPNAAYADNHAEPVRTVDLFEKLLPYAMVLGVEKEWSKQFEGLYNQPPEWYTGSNLNTFSAGYLVGSLNGGFNQAVSTSFAAPQSSSGSGFGGGSSGGGGGGGGGGGW